MSRESIQPLSTQAPLAARPVLILVEDEAALRRALQLHLFNQGFDVRAFSAAAPVLADGSADEATVLIADYRLPDMDGLALLERLHARGWHGRAVLITGFLSRALSQAANIAGFAAVLEKPVPHHRLVAAIGGAPQAA